MSIVDGHWLNDTHIMAASKLLKKKYPHQNGLQSTQLLAKKLEWKSSNVNFVQIIHISGNHWVCTSNMNSPPGVCDVYDSMAASNSPTLSRQVAAMMKCSEPALTLRYINVQMQGGASDCALFAIAFAVTLSEGDDPHKSSFNQQLMRSHLMECFENGDITKFPPSIKPRRCTSSIKSSKTVQLYCTCRLPWDKEFNIHGSLAQCAQCKNWYHKNCLTIPSAAFIEHTFIWFCTFCSTHKNY